MDIIEAIIPKGRKRRPSIKMTPKYITIHNTGCANVPADNFRRSVLDPSQDKEVSWHFTIDEKEIIQHIPTNEVAWHAGNRDGNYSSIGVEICERAGAEEKAIKFVAQLCKELGFTTKQIRTHKSWSGKQCPHLILPHWDKFVENVDKELALLNKPKAPEWQVAALKGVVEKVGLDKSYWTEDKLNNPITVGELMGLLNKIVK